MNRENLVGRDEINPSAAQWDMADAPQFGVGEVHMLHPQDNGIFNNAVYEAAPEIDTGIFNNSVYEPAPEDAETKEQQNTARQQRKMVGALLTCSNLDTSADVLNEHDVTLPEGARDELLDMINDGRITRYDERSVLRLIDTDMQKIGGANILGKLQDKHERRIAAWISGTGFDNYQNLSPKSLENLFFSYPCAMDFEAVLPQLVEWVREGNGDKKAAEYQAAGESFMKKFYGKQAEYLEQINVINADAESRKNAVRKLVIESGSGSSAEAAARAAAETERSYEWDPGTVSYCQTSRTQASRGEIFRDKLNGELWADNSCEDSVLSRADKLVFGVFDGAAGMGNGATASRFVADSISRYCDSKGINDLSGMVDAVYSAKREMEDRDVPGYTTATIGKIVGKEDGIYLAYLSIGDSRLYIIHEDGTGELITQDEGFEHQITNAISQDYGEVKQYGEYKLKRGDKIMMCSDGITGDRGADLMSVEEVCRIVKNSRDSEDASRNLVASARKRDDRTALVIGAW